MPRSKSKAKPVRELRYPDVSSLPRFARSLPRDPGEDFDGPCQMFKTGQRQDISIVCRGRCPKGGGRCTLTVTRERDILVARCECQKRCCLQTFNVPANRSGNKVIMVEGDQRKAGEEFDMLATFSNSGNQGRCACLCCEYRQYVRGTFKYKGEILDYRLESGELMSPTEFKEDSVRGYFNPHYGHRSEPGDKDDLYLPTRREGCEYRGHDFPNITGEPGARFAIDLEFRGEIIDVCNGGVVVASSTWTIKFSGRLSRRRRYWD
jgi:hypothetical protein